MRQKTSSQTISPQGYRTAPWLLTIAIVGIFFQTQCRCMPNMPQETGDKPKKNEAVTDAMIQKAEAGGKNSEFLAAYLKKLQNCESVDVNARYNDTYNENITVAMEAAMLGDVDIFKFILQQKPNLNLQDDQFHRTPLHWAVHFGHPEIVRIILEQPGVDLTLRSDYSVNMGQTPLNGRTALKYATGLSTSTSGSKKNDYKTIIKLLRAKRAPL
jgi:hypothetical protein